MDTSNQLTVHAQAQAKAEIARATIALTTTVGVNSAACGAYDTIGVSPGATLYYCLTIKNTGNLTLTNFAIKDTLLGIDQNFAYALKPGALLVISPATPTGLPSDLIAKLTVTNAQTGVADTFTVIATANGGLSNTQSDNTQVSVGVPVIGLFKYLERDPSSCAPTASLTVAVGEQIYYCLRVENRGQVALTSHQISEAATGISTSEFTYSLEPNAVLTLTQTLLATLLTTAQNQRLGPFTFGANVVNVVTFTSKTTQGVSTVANASAAVILPQVTTVATVTPTPSITPTPGPTNTFTPIPTSTWTPTPIPTPSPTGTPAPVVASLLPTPTWTPNFLLTGVTTPGGVTQQGQSPLPLPNNGQQPISPLPAPTIDNGAVAAAQTAAAIDATATGVALLAQPTPVPTETPTLSSTLTATMTVAAAAPAATVRPLEYPSPTPPAEFLVLFAKVVDASIAAAGWIWFICGSLIFFVTAGLMAGLGFRHQHRPRYALVDNPNDSDEDRYQTVPAPSPAPMPAPPTRPTTNSTDDDYWPASLP
ncbi:MAG: hypothetical protein NT075_17630, partial [Chloroflexi bacterium]|nr:hypothetical protein [Chloroflexota bacterium]